MYYILYFINKVRNFNDDIITKKINARELKQLIKQLKKDNIEVVHYVGFKTKEEAKNYEENTEYDFSRNSTQNTESEEELTPNYLRCKISHSWQVIVDNKEVINTPIQDEANAVLEHYLRERKFDNVYIVKRSQTRYTLVEGDEYRKLGQKAYREHQSEARREAQDWQLYASENDLSYGELAEASARFTKLGKRYGLLKEFKENGII